MKLLLSVRFDLVMSFFFVKKKCQVQQLLIYSGLWNIIGILSSVICFCDNAYKRNKHFETIQECVDLCSLALVCQIDQLSRINLQEPPGNNIDSFISNMTYKKNTIQFFSSSPLLHLHPFPARMERGRGEQKFLTS